jgi:GGDEF domain-containing protein
MAERTETILGLRRVALIELGVMVTLIVALDFLAGDGTRFRAVVPHPFWLPVLLLVVQYGTNEGLLAAIFCTAALYVGNLPPQTIETDIYAYLFAVTLQPTLWVVSAVVFGELRMRQIRRENALRERLGEAEKRNDVLTGAYEQLSKVKEQLEVRVAGQLRTVVSTYQAAKAIEKLGPAEVMLGVSDLVRAIMAPTKFSIYVTHNDSLEAMINEGWEADDKFQRRFDASSALFQAIVAEKRILCVADPKDERILAGEALLAGPLINADTGGMFGMVKIEALGFLEINVATVENFRVLCEWIGTAFAHALRYVHAEASSVLAQDGLLMSAGFFERQSAFLKALGERVGFEVIAVILRVDNVEGTSTEMRLAVSKALAEAVHAELRTTDLAFDLRHKGYQFAVLLPATPIENGRKVADKIVAGIRRRLPQGAEALSVGATVQVLFRRAEKSEPR